MTDLITLSTSTNVAQVFRKVAMRVVLIGVFTNDSNANEFADSWQADNGGEMPIVNNIGSSMPERMIYEPPSYECV
jgi:hypothetical protein